MKKKTAAPRVSAKLHPKPRPLLRAALIVAASQHPQIKSNPTHVEFFKDIVATIREPLVVLDTDLRVLSANRSFYKFFKVKAGETVGNLIYALGNRQWDIPALRALLETILPQKAVFNDYEVEHEFPTIGRRTLLLNARRIPGPPKEPQLILLAFEDVTLRMRLERTLGASEERFRRAFETAHDGILLIEKTGGQIVNSNQAAQELLGYSDRELLKRNLWEMGILKDHRQFKQIFVDLEKQGVVELLNITIQTRHSGHFPADVYLLDKAAVIQCNIRDITEPKRIIDALKENEKKYFDLVNQTPDGIFLIGLSGKILTVNKSMCKELGYSKEELLSMNIWDIIPEQYLDQHRKRLTKILEGKSLEEAAEYALRAKDGKMHYVDVLSAPHYSGKDITGFQGIARDITTRKRMEEALKGNEYRLASIYDTVGDVIFYLTVEPNGQYRFASVNAAFCKVTGLQAQAVTGKRVNEIIPEPALTMVLGKYKQAITEKTIIRWEETSDYPAGRLTGEVSVAPVFDEAGACTHLVGSVHDITKRKEAEEKLAASEAELRALFAGMTDVVVVYDTDGRYIKIAPTNPANLYRPPDEMQDKTVHDILPKEQADYIVSKIRESIQTGQVVNGEYALQVDGKEIWFSATASRLSETTAIFVAHDITERKRVEMHLAYQANLLANVSDAVTASDDRFILTAWNRAAENMFGWKSEEVLGRPGQEVFRSEFIDIDRPEVYRRVKETGQFRGEMIQYRKDGTSIYVEANTFAMQNESGQTTGYVTISRDVTERKRAEEALRKSEEKYRGLVTEISDGIFITDDRGALTFVNPALARIHGFEHPDQLVGRYFTDFIAPPMLDEVTRYFRQVVEGEHTQMAITVEVVRPDGTQAVVEVKASVSFEQEGGKVVGTHGVVRDVTERKRAEEGLKEANAKLTSAQRIAHVGSWNNYLPTNQLDWSEEMYRILGFPLNTPVNLADATRVFPLGELERFQKAVGAAINEDLPYSMDYKIIRPDGAVRYIHDEGEIVRDEQGKAIWMLGTTHDITERKRAEEEIKNQLKELQRWQKATLGRESRILDLKREVNELLGQASQPPRYPSAESQENKEI